ncbi:MAG: helix-turn-helix domain-containing protein [Oscillospiraceae bacterium]|nr:helix-turn-helix domain-containing protein [Oscillospiraceae bacterium]
MIYICNMRKQARLTQSEVARTVGISTAAYKYIENQKRNPSIKVAKRLGNYFGFDWKLFFEENETQSKEPASKAILNAEAEKAPAAEQLRLEAAR